MERSVHRNVRWNTEANPRVEITCVVWKWDTYFRIITSAIVAKGRNHSCRLSEETGCRTSLGFENGEIWMTINPYASSSIRDNVLQLAQTKLQNAHSDVQSRNDHIQAMKDDFQAGNLDGAKQEQQAALASEQNVLADRTALTDFHKNVASLRGEFSQRTQDFQTFRSDMQAGDVDGAKAAFQAMHQDQQAIRSDLQGLGINGQPTPSPLNVTA